MGIPRTLGAVVVGALPPTPIYTGPVINAVSFSILRGIATIVLGPGNLPSNGYNGPNGFPVQNATTGASLDIYGGVSGQNNAGSPNNGGNAAGGQQVTLWAFTTATYFNAKTITVLDCNPAAGSFRFYFNHADVASTADAGKTAAIPVQRYRTIRLEASLTNGTDIVYVGDLNVSPTRYMAALTLAGQSSIMISFDNAPADRVFITGTGPTDSVQA